MQVEPGALQWGGRFTGAPDADLLAYGSSLDDDLVLAPFDIRCSLAHVAALEGGAIIDAATASALRTALTHIEHEIARGDFTEFARAGSFEDVHGAIDARVRALAPQAGEALHSGRSRNDQVATTLLLYARDRASDGRERTAAIARAFLERAEAELHAGTLLAATTHWQPAQPVLLAFWLHAAAEGFVRAAHRFDSVARDAARFCPLGSAALAGSSLPLDRDAAARVLEFGEPSRNALDSVGDRDVALDLLSAAVRAVVTASRSSEEFVLWTTPAFGYARLGDAASTGSSLMPQKRNPDPFELVRAAAARATGTLAGALATTCGIGLSYHRDLQATKAAVIEGTERAAAALCAFAGAFAHLHFERDTMTARATRAATVATDLADALIARGVSARTAHRLVGETVAESDGDAPLGSADLERLRARAGIADLDAPLDGHASVAAKRTSGSTAPAALTQAIASTRAELASLSRRTP